MRTSAMKKCILSIALIASLSISCKKTETCQKCMDVTVNSTGGVVARNEIDLGTKCGDDLERLKKVNTTVGGVQHYVRCQ